VKIDGLYSSYSPGSYANTINNRLAVPSYIDIDVDMVGGYTGGTAYVSVTAEQEPALAGVIKVWCAITEDHEIATYAWGGGYNGKEMMWIPVSFPLGSVGQILNFTGPYPQTIDVEGVYTLSPTAHPYENLNVVTFVQYASGTRECLNADYINLAETTGISEDEGGISGDLFIEAGPNPSNGTLSISCTLPSEETGTVQIFDISGRIVESFPAAETMNASIEASGVYFVQLTTGSGEVATSQLTVIR